MDDRRLIEDFIPVKEISAESSREKSLRHGHISTIHLWWARRPLVACRAAVYASLVPADFHAPANGNGKNRASLSRANAAKFMTSLCKYPGNPKIIEEARQHILKAHYQRTGEDGPPKVLDCFAGGGAIPLEALRLGCESHALELNPVAYLILLCTVVYPQKYGKPDPSSHWKGFAEEVEKWGNWVLENVKKEVGDLYPPIPDPEAAPVVLEKQKQSEFKSREFKRSQPELTMPGDYLTPVAYLWTRTVRCGNPRCGATVPLVRQTWLCKKAGRYIALKINPLKVGRLQFEVVRSSHRTEAAAIDAFGFNPSDFGKAGNSACPHCGTVADSDYVKQEAQAGRMSREMMAVVCTRPGRQGKVYLSAADLSDNGLPSDVATVSRINKLAKETGLTPPDEPLVDKAADQLPLYGYSKYAQLFTPRQLLSLFTFVKWVRHSYEKMLRDGYVVEYAKVVAAALGLWIDRISAQGCSICRWDNSREMVPNAFSRQAIAMVWDFAEVEPFGNASGNASNALEWITQVIAQESKSDNCANVLRGNAADMPFQGSFFDAIVCDPPYYDNISYASLSDFFYVWLKRSVGHLYPEHFSTELTPKKSEIVADPWRQGGKDKARHFYEEMMQKSLAEMHRVLKPEGVLTLVYAHKTVKGWETLVEALRSTGFVVQEAWPLDTEMGNRPVAMDTSALASSIFITTRKEGQKPVGEYDEVRRELV